MYTHTCEQVYNSKNYYINDDNSNVIRTEAFSRTVQMSRQIFAPFQVWQMNFIDRIVFVSVSSF